MCEVCYTNGNMIATCEMCLQELCYKCWNGIASGRPAGIYDDKNDYYADKQCADCACTYKCISCKERITKLVKSKCSKCKNPLCQDCTKDGRALIGCASCKEVFCCACWTGRVGETEFLQTDSDEYCRECEGRPKEYDPEDISHCTKEGCFEVLHTSTEPEELGWSRCSHPYCDRVFCPEHSRIDPAKKFNDRLAPNPKCAWCLKRYCDATVADSCFRGTSEPMKGAGAQSKELRIPLVGGRNACGALACATCTATVMEKEDVQINCNACGKSVYNTHVRPADDSIPKKEIKCGVLAARCCTSCRSVKAGDGKGRTPGVYCLVCARDYIRVCIKCEVESRCFQCEYKNERNGKTDFTSLQKEWASLGLVDEVADLEYWGCSSCFKDDKSNK